MTEPCPLCGTEVRVVGHTTKHYEPVENILEKEGEEFIDIFRKKMKKISEETLSSIYVDLMPHIQTDAWVNFRNDVRTAMQSEYARPEYLRSEDGYAREFRTQILTEHRESIIEGLNQDMLKRIANLEESLKREWERR